MRVELAPNDLERGQTRTLRLFWQAAAAAADSSLPLEEQWRSREERILVWNARECSQTQTLFSLYLAYTLMAEAYKS